MPDVAFSRRISPSSSVNAAPRTADYHNALGCAYTRLEKFDEAERSLERAIALENRAEFHSSLGALRKRQNRLPEAIAAFSFLLFSSERNSA